MINSELLGISFLHCYVLFTVAKHKNISKAAEELHMTQSTVTKIIQRAEDTLHLRLFQRTNKGCTLTEDGDFIIRRWKDTFQEMDTALEELYVKKRSNKHKLSIALGNMLRGSSCFWPHVEKFQKKHPETVLEVSGGELWELRPRLLDGTLDILIVPEFEKELCKENSLQWCCVQTGHAVVHHNRNHKLSSPHPQSLYEFKDETFLIADTSLIKGYENYVLTSCQQAGFTPTKIIKQQNQYMIEYFLKRDEAILLGDEFFLMADNMPDVVSTVIPNLSFSVIAMWKGDTHNPATANFVALFDDINGST